MPWRPPAVSRGGALGEWNIHWPVTWPQGRGQLSHPSMFMNLLPTAGDSGLLGLILALGIKEKVSAVLLWEKGNKNSPVLLL